MVMMMMMMQSALALPYETAHRLLGARMPASPPSTFVRVGAGRQESQQHPPLTAREWDFSPSQTDSEHVRGTPWTIQDNQYRCTSYVCWKRDHAGDCDER